MSITADNAANNNTLLKEIGTACAMCDINFNYKKNHVRCLAHIINLTSQEILKNVNAGEAQEENTILAETEISQNSNMEIIPKLRKLIVKIRCSPQRRDKFAHRCDLYSNNNENIKSLNLILDIRTRWNSTFLMLERALKLREVSKYNVN
jgi:hypothetical protein